jgi:hypothetical protein
VKGAPALSIHYAARSREQTLEESRDFRPIAIGARKARNGSGPEKTPRKIPEKTPRKIPGKVILILSAPAEGRRLYPASAGLSRARTRDARISGDVSRNGGLSPCARSLREGSAVDLSSGASRVAWEAIRGQNESISAHLLPVFHRQIKSLSQPIAFPGFPCYTTGATVEEREEARKRGESNSFIELPSEWKAAHH